MRPNRPYPEPPDTDTSADPPVTGPPTWRRPGRLLRERAATLALAALGVAVLALALVLWRTYGTDEQELAPVDVGAAVEEALASQTPAPAASALVYQAILPSLVVVRTDKTDEGQGFGLGTGVVVNGEAHVLTAYHIIEGSNQVQLSYVDGTSTYARVENVDAARDIAVLSPSTMPGLVAPATIGGVSALSVGDEVFAVGNPLGLAASLSAGVVSGLGREFKPPGRDESIEGPDPVRRGRQSRQLGRPAREPRRPGRWPGHRAHQPHQSKRIHRHRVRGAH